MGALTFEQLAGAFGALAQRVEAAQPALSRHGAERVKEVAQANCPYQSGRLHDSARIEEDARGCTVVFDAPYAWAVHERTEVRHPNGKAKFLEDAVREVSREIVGDVAEALEDVLKGAAEGVESALGAL